MRIVTMREKILSLSHIGSQSHSASRRNVRLDRLALLQIVGFAGTSRHATWTLDSVRPALRQTAARQSLSPSICCNAINANHIRQPGPPMRSRTTWHKHGQFACTARSLPHGQRGLATGSWLLVVLLCRMLLCVPVIRLHRDAASRTIDADRLEGVRWAVASMSCLVVCSLGEKAGG
jgi:hypothetical protein